MSLGHGCDGHIPFSMSRRNSTFWSKVGETGVGETGVGKQVPISDFHHLPYVSGNEVLMVQFKVLYVFYSYLEPTHAAQS